MSNGAGDIEIFGKFLEKEVPQTRVRVWGDLE
jgi:hypothetical protein